jgi:TIR domain
VPLDSFFSRLKRKARANQLAVALGGDLSGSAAIPRLAEQIRDHFGIEIEIKLPPYEYYLRWNNLIELVEQGVSRETLMAFILERADSVVIQPLHRKIACLPISNFIDFTFDRSLTKALIEGGKHPIVHDFAHHSMGSWRQSNPDRPNVFFSFADLRTQFRIFGVYEQLCRHPQNRIQVENMMEMLRGKDLLILGFSSFEAEGILHLEYLAGAADKVVNTSDPIEDYAYWTRRGVFLADVPSDEAIEYLLPSNLRSYSGWDLPFPGRMLIDVAKEKQYDCFICYFSGDKAFAVKLEADLNQRDLRPWRDEGEIEVGDSISDKLELALKDSYSFVIILSKEALQRPWVREELRAAFSLRVEEQLKILPVLYKDCEMPVFLMDYKHADFREEKNYAEQLEFLARSIQNAVGRARRKK